MHPNFTMPVAYIQQANLIFCVVWVKCLVVVLVRLISAGLRLVQSEGNRHSPAMTKEFTLSLLAFHVKCMESQ